MSKNIVTFVTGNKNKLSEFSAILEDVKNFELTNRKIDLDEIQSLSLEEIVEHKVRQAYDIVNGPVLVEDTGFFIDQLNGLPGPLIKFFLDKLGNNAPVKLIRDSKNRGATAKVCVGFYDGKNLIIVVGEMVGKISDNESFEDGFGFDVCFIPDGYSKTLTELDINVKNKISARKNAIEKFKEEYEKINLRRIIKN